MMEGVGALIGLLILDTKIYSKVGLWDTSMGLMEISLSYG